MIVVIIGMAVISVNGTLNSASSLHPLCCRSAHSRKRMLACLSYSTKEYFECESSLACFKYSGLLHSCCTSCTDWRLQSRRKLAAARGYEVSQELKLGYNLMPACQEAAGSPEAGDPSWAGGGEPRMPAGSYCDACFEEDFAEDFCTSAAVCSCCVCSRTASEAVAGCTRFV